MKRPRDLSPLGEFELLVLLAVLRGDGDAYGATILKDLEDRTGRPLSRGALYVTLDRLEGKGYVSSRTGDAAPARGGRPRRYYAVRPIGLTLLRQSLDALRQMSEGLALKLKHP